jgi:DoxX-like family
MANQSNGKNSKVLFILGWVISALPILLIAMGFIYAFTQPDMMHKQMDKYGYPPGAAMPILIAEICSVILFAIPRTAMLGAILLTGYLGGAISTHVRAGEPFYMPAVVGVLPWLGLYLRDPRVRKLIPLR